MIVCTVLLLVLLATLLPLRLKLGITLVPDGLSAHVAVRLYGIKVFDEQVFVQQGMLVFSGSVSQCMRIVDLDFSGGTELFKAIAVERIDLLSRVGLLNSPVFVCFVRLFTSAVGKIAAFVNVDVGSVSVPTVGKTEICVAAKITTSLCEIGICLLNQAFSVKRAD